MNNAFYEVSSPFRVFRHVGRSPSNNYVGASRMITTVMEAINARRGDRIHALVGGTFLLRDGVLSPISLNAPKPPFEKSYGHVTDRSILKTYAQRGLASETEAPKGETDYRSANAKVDANRLADLHQEIIHVDNSPEFEAMNAVVAAFVDEISAAGRMCSVKHADIDCYGGPKFDLTVGTSRFRVSAGAHGVFAVEVPDSVTVAGVKDPIHNHGRFIHHFRTIDGVADPLAAAKDFLSSCGRFVTEAAPGMGM